MIRVADNLQILRPSIQTAVERRDPEPIANLVRKLARAGADAIDINAGPCTRDPSEVGAFLVRTVQDATRLPVLIDTANPIAMAAGLRVCRERPILNGFSLEPETMETAAACRALTAHGVFSWAALDLEMAGINTEKQG